jgi:hypothetical protein
MTMLCPQCWGAAVPCTCCNGLRRIPDENLSPHFLLSEFLLAPGAIRAGVPNVPTRIDINHLVELCHDTLEPLREALGPIIITSGFRSPAVNASIPGASATSAHMEGSAADLHLLKHTLREGLDWLASHTLVPLDQVIYEYGSWLHVGRRAGRIALPRRQVLMKFADEGYRPFDLADPRVTT